jgi:enoyl-CoA hydratase
MTKSIIRKQPHSRVVLLQLAASNSLNPLTDELMDELVGELLKNEADPGVSVTVLTGTERAFAAGADIAAMSQLDYPTVFQLDYIGRNWDVLRSLRKPLIAAVDGYAFGGGCELAMICDIVIASEHATFGQPEVKLGIVPGAGGTQRLPRAVGKSSAMLMCLSGEPVTARDAMAMGLVSKVTSRDELVADAVEVAKAIATHSLPVVMAIKEAVSRSFETSLSEGLLFERRVFQAGFSLADQKEGMAAFLERRTAVFTGR